MLRSSGRVTEEEVAIAVGILASRRTSKTVTFDSIREELPDVIELSSNDKTMSKTRPNEPMWHQIFRNIRSHFEDEGNFIFEGFLEHIPETGYKVTKEGEEYLQKRGFI